MNIEISKHLYSRLSKHVEGFEKPESVIERILNYYENRRGASKPEIFFIPNENVFKEFLLEKKVAWKVLEFTDGSTELERWSATRFSESSNLKANLWSGTLRNWQVKGIKKLTLSIEKPNHYFEENEGVTASIDIQIGKFIQKHLDAIAKHCKENSAHVNELSSLEWSQNHFELSSFPFMSLSSSVSMADTVRYWAPEYVVQGKKYRFCSQFGGNTMVGTKTKSEYQGQKVIQYLKVRGLLAPEYQDVDINFIVNS